MRTFWNSLYLNQLTFIGLAVAAVFYLLGHYTPAYLWAGHAVLILLFILLMLDLFLLYRGEQVSGHRHVAKVLSNGDENAYSLTVENRYGFAIETRVYDEIPHQLGLREQYYDVKIASNTSRTIDTPMMPKLRGSYTFGDIVVMVKSPLRLIKRRYHIPAQEEVAVYPSFIHLNRYSLRNFKYYTRDAGTKRTRRIGHSMEFEQIKEYVKGDDIRYINWKASAKRGDLMVNQYIDERAQQVYCVIDSGRAMQMPFDGLSLLDYAINSTLALSHIIIKKNDRAGVVHFNKRVERILPADRGVAQLPKILNTLYNLKTEFFESNFEKLYADIKFKINQRSLVILFSNFEEMDALKRQLPYLKGISKNNVLLVVFFKNREIEDLVQQRATHSSNYYQKAIAEKLVLQKKRMVKELNTNGIQTLLSDPKTLTADTIDKYLEIKNKGLI